MFFIGIFGVESKEKKLSRIEDFECKTNSCNGGGTVFKYYHYFHMFFLPLFKWGEEYYVKCDKCSGVFKVSKEKGKDFESGKCKLTYWDLTEVKKGFVEKKCPACGFKIDDEYSYCPKCGTKT